MYLFLCDTPTGFLGLIFQEPATSTMDGIFLFNSHLLFIIINIVLFIWWLLFLISKNFFDTSSYKIKNFSH